MALACRRGDEGGFTQEAAATPTLGSADTDPPGQEGERRSEPPLSAPPWCSAGPTGRCCG